MERKLAAILCADVYGYSRLMGEDEEATLRTLTSHRKLIDFQIENHHGRFVNSAGDSVLAAPLSTERADCSDAFPVCSQNVEVLVSAHRFASAAAQNAPDPANLQRGGRRNI